MSKTKSTVKRKYNKKSYDRIEISVPKGEKAIIQTHAISKKESTNAFIQRAIKQTMEQEKESQG